MAQMWLIRECKQFNEFAEASTEGTYQVLYHTNFVLHHPLDSKKTIEAIGRQIEGTRHVEALWFECVSCDFDATEGDYVYFLNKFWKIVGTKVIEDCGHLWVKLVVERLEPRETHKALIECVSCFEGKLVKGNVDCCKASESESEVRDRVRSLH